MSAFFRAIALIVPSLLLSAALSAATDTPTTPSPAVKNENRAPFHLAVQGISEFAVTSSDYELTVADKTFLEARSAFKAKNSKALDAQVRKLPSDYPLKAYADLWSLILKLKKDPDDIASQKNLQSFITRHKNEYIAERAKTDWARIAADKNDVNRFRSLFKALQWNQSETDIQCYSTLFRLNDSKKDDKETLLQAKAFLAKSPARIGPVYLRLSNEVIARDPDWAFTQLLLLTEQKRYRTAAEFFLSGNFDKKELPADTSILLANPKKWLEKQSDLSKLSIKSLALAAIRVTPLSNENARELATQLDVNKAPEALRNAVWGYLGTDAALHHAPTAAEFFDNAGTKLSDNPYLFNTRHSQIWQLRAYLRAQNWKQVLACIETLPNDMQQTSAWLYWKAVAQSRTKQVAPSQTSFTAAAQFRDFYGLLAKDQLGKSYTDGLNVNLPVLNKDSVKKFATALDLHRARKFYDLGLPYEGNREWNWYLRSVKTDEYRLQLALFAAKEGLIHRATRTAERVSQPNFPLLYPKPFRQDILTAVKEASIPERTLYGLIRQESNFVYSARSSVGARGLMQIMPATAKVLVRKLSLSGYKPSNLSDVGTNLYLGSQYLRMLEEKVGPNIILIASGYNAGPGRVDTWKKRLLSPMDPAIFAESIPFNETRDYAMRVAANICHYSLYENKPIRISDLISTVDSNLNLKEELP